MYQSLSGSFVKFKQVGFKPIFNFFRKVPVSSVLLCLNKKKNKKSL